MAVTQRTAGATLRFDATLSAIDTSTVLRLPESASTDLPSRRGGWPSTERSMASSSRRCSNQTEILATG